MKKNLNPHLAMLCIAMAMSAQANNIVVANVGITNQNVPTQSINVKLDLSWENSWRLATGPANWDAAWVFIKYRLKSSIVWNHATLNWVNGLGGAADGHTAPAGSYISSSNDTGAGGAKGVFIYSSSATLPQGLSHRQR